jgi:hypothetical protein
MSEIDVTNKWLVGFDGETIGFGNPRALSNLTPDDALVLAAYLVLMAEPFSDHVFSEVTRAVMRA